MKFNFSMNAVISILAVVLAGLVGVAGFMAMSDPAPETQPTETTQTPETAAPSTAPTETLPPPTEPDPKLIELQEMNAFNEDIDCWIQIEDTIIDYPVAYTPDEPEKYDRLSVEGKYSYHGTIYIGKQSSLDPESDNLIIYGHNLENGNMFSDLLLYKDEEYWEEHPEIKFYTLEGGRTYEILAAFYDRIYYTYEDDFRFYRFVDAEDEEDWDDTIAIYKNKALYDTGVEAEYGDRLMTLVTCSYHHKYGRFVVIAVEHMEKDVPEIGEPTEPVAPEITGPAA